MVFRFVNDGIFTRKMDIMNCTLTSFVCFNDYYVPEGVSVRVGSWPAGKSTLVCYAEFAFNTKTEEVETGVEIRVQPSYLHFENFSEAA